MDVNLSFSETGMFFFFFIFSCTLTYLTGLALTHISIASYLWDIGKQYSPRGYTHNAASRSGALEEFN